MNYTEISNARIFSQMIEKTNFDSTKKLVEWMGAIQAQDFSMAKWAIGLRLLKANETSIDEVYNDGEILRTHVMRPTWHIVPAEDIHWMLDLTAPRIIASMKTRDRHLELTQDIYRESTRILERVLSDSTALTREELAVFFNEAKIRIDENRFSHILLRAELDGLICSGPLKNTKISYSLLDKRVPVKKLLSKEESLATLATRYFRSHGPATLKDFTWWSGLTVTDARNAIQLVKNDFIEETLDNNTYYFNTSYNAKISGNSLHFLPAYDEFLISYADRTPSILGTHNKKAISENGIFRPLLVLNGQVIGTWKRASRNGKVLIEPVLFEPVNREFETEAMKTIKRYETFLEKNVEMRPAIIIT